jgi:5,6-dimethylbenzimidazole synthase
LKPDESLTGAEKDGLYKAIFSRRDVRSHFVDRKIPDDALLRILNAAHHAPSARFCASASAPFRCLITTGRARNSTLH